MAPIDSPASSVLVPGPGHSAHLEQPDRFGDLVDGWLDALPPA
jgi:pimeloyl-ACP methyl ester carboxylesterase